MTHLSFFVALCFILLCGSHSHAQTWEKKQEVNGNISYVGFNRFSPNTQVGYFGVLGSTHQLWRTSNGGENWTKIIDLREAAPVDMTFKDEMTGWMITGLAQTGTVYKTTDGGLTWTKQPLDHNGTAIKYVHATGLLFASAWRDITGSDASFVSDNEGLTWTPFNIGGLNGYTFADGQNGLASVLYDSYIRTTNGGQTWERLVFNLEAWQPLSIPNTQTYFIASELNAALYRTDDHGSTWELIHVFPGDRMFLSGDLKGGLCGLIVQARSTTDPNLNGFFLSEDEGLTWTSIGGPANFQDTRFDLVGRTLFAGESSDFANRTSGLWKFELPSDVGTTEARLLLTFDDGERMKTLVPDEKATIVVHLSEAIPAELNAGSIAFDLVYDASAASIENLTAHQGWIISQTQPIAAGLRVRLSKLPGSPIEISPLVSFELKPFFGISENRGIAIENISISSTPQQPVKCFAINPMGDEIAYDLSFNNCEDSLLFRLLDGRAPLEILSIRPNPANASQIVSVELVAASEDDVSFSLIGSDGKIARAEHRLLSVGRNAIALTTQGLSSGVYTLAVQSQGIARRRNIVIK